MQKQKRNNPIKNDVEKSDKQEQKRQIEVVTCEKNLDVIQQNRGKQSSELKEKFYKITVNKKLTIFFLEDTTDVMTQNDKLQKLLQMTDKSGIVSIIKYGSDIKQYINVNKTDEQVLCSKGDKACLYDALIELEKLVSKAFRSTIDGEKEIIQIDSVEIIGMGTCIDNCSITEKAVAINTFSKMARSPFISTKYFCITEQDFTKAAEIGFRSIGAVVGK